MRLANLVGFGENVGTFRAARDFVDSNGGEVWVPYHHRSIVDGRFENVAVMPNPLTILPKGSAELPITAQERESLLWMVARTTPRAAVFELSRVANTLLGSADEQVARSGCREWVFSDVPHSAPVYAIFLAARARGLRCHLLKRGPSPFHHWVNSDIVVPRDVTDLSGSGADLIDGTRLADWVATLTRSYSEGRPAFMASATTKDRLAAISRTLLKGPTAVAGRSIARVRWEANAWQMRQMLERVSRQHSIASRRVTLFLHLQPERTTTPEAGEYADQSMAVAVLREGLPADVEVVVREHPITFRYIRDSSVVFRSPQFYEQISRMDRVRFDGSLDSFAAIDASSAIATCTGTVGVEAIARGCPVLYFGDAPFAGLHGAFPVLNASTVTSAFRTISEGMSLSGETVIRYLKALEGRSDTFVVPTGHRDDVVPAFLAKVVESLSGRAP